MRNDFNNIDNIFKEGLGGYTEVPPPDVWDALESRLDNDKKKRPFGWRWIVVMLCCVGLFGSLYAWKMHTPSADTADSAGDIAVASTTPVADNKSTQTNSTGNTSATEEQSTTANHKKHSQKAHDINNTNPTNNNSVHEPTTPDNVVSTGPKPVTSPNIPDKSAMAMAGTGSLTASPKQPAVQYIVSNNRNRNNIQATESEPVNTGYSFDDNEEDMTFGKKSTASNMEPAAHKLVAAIDDEDLPVTALKHAPAPKKNIVIASRTTASNIYAGAVASSQPTSTVARRSHTNNATRTVASSTNAYSIGNGLKSTHAATTTAATKPATSTVAKADQPIKTATTTTLAKPYTTPAKEEPKTVATTTATKEAKPAVSTVTDTKTVATTTPIKKHKVHKTTTATTAVAVVKPTTAKPVVAATRSTHTLSAAKHTATATTPVAAKHTATKAATPTQPAVAVKADNKDVIAKTTAPTAKTHKAIAAKHTATPSKPVAVTTGAATKSHKSVKPAAIKTVAAKPTIAAIKKEPKTKPLPVARVTKEKKPVTKKPTVATTVVAVKNSKKKDKKGNTKTATKTINNIPGTPTVAAIQPIVPQAQPTVTTPPATTKVMNTFKDQPTAPMMAVPHDSTPVTAAVNTPDSSKKHFKFGPFIYGVKAGYEGGFTRDASNKLVISPYIERQITSKFSLMLQPAIKSSRARTNAVGDAKNYYKAYDGSITNIDTFLIPVIQNNQSTGYLIRINQSYKQTHDSIVKSYATGGNYMEFELPILLKYKINPKLSVYGGVSLNYSRLIQVKENTFTSSPIKLNDTSFTIYPIASQPIGNVLKYTGNDISTYSGPAYPTQTGGIFRLGYMLGFSYELKKRWMIDALMQKAPSKTNMQGGTDVNKGLSTTYFRITLGYRLSK